MPPKLVPAISSGTNRGPRLYKTCPNQPPKRMPTQILVCVCVASVECEFGPCVYVRWESCVRACACVLQALQVKCTLRERSRREQRDK
jgi:hypothetical protein